MVHVEARPSSEPFTGELTVSRIKEGSAQASADGQETGQVNSGGAQQQAEPTAAATTDPTKEGVDAQDNSGDQDMDQGEAMPGNSADQVQGQGVAEDAGAEQRGCAQGQAGAGQQDDTQGQPDGQETSYGNSRGQASRAEEADGQAEGVADKSGGQVEGIPEDAGGQAQGVAEDHTGAGQHLYCHPRDEPDHSMVAGVRFFLDQLWSLQVGS
jgi:hypothetical protein